MKVQGSVRREGSAAPQRAVAVPPSPTYKIAAGILLGVAFSSGFVAVLMGYKVITWNHAKTGSYVFGGVSAVTMMAGSFLLQRAVQAQPARPPVPRRPPPQVDPITASLQSPRPPPKPQWKQEIESSAQALVNEKRYARQRLQPRTLIDGNRTYSIENYRPAKITHSVHHATLFTYSSGDIDDKDWGSGHRMLQMVLSSILPNTENTFASAFHRFGPKAHLIEIWRDLNRGAPLPDYLREWQQAPYDHSEGWTEPFAVQLACHFHGVGGILAYVNQLPANHLSPAEAFSVRLQGDAFLNRIEQHFQQPNPLPIALDNGRWSLVIFGVGRENGNRHLWMGDPHVARAKNRDPQELPAGLYTLTLDRTGTYVSCSMHTEVTEQALLSKMMYPTDFSAERAADIFNFNSGHWMVFFPRCN